MQPPYTHVWPGVLTLHQVVLTLSTVVACVSLGAGAGVIRAAASIHTPDITRLNCKGEEKIFSVNYYPSTVF